MPFRRASMYVSAACDSTSAGHQGSRQDDNTCQTYIRNDKIQNYQGRLTPFMYQTPDAYTPEPFNDYYYPSSGVLVPHSHMGGQVPHSPMGPQVPHSPVGPHTSLDDVSVLPMGEGYAMGRPIQSPGPATSGMMANRMYSSPLYQDSSVTGSMPAPSSPPVLPRVNKPCVICTDRSSGYHYGVSSCEGCKGFFRRSIQRNMSYACHKDQRCPINKMTRNRCQYCRLQKCFAKGMNKESVRNDKNRRGKKDKSASPETVAAPPKPSLSDEDTKNIETAEQSHISTFPRELEDPVYYVDPSQLELCNDVLWERLQEFSTSGLTAIVEFAKKVPGFLALENNDQVILLKAACFEILILRLSSRFEAQTETFSLAGNITLHQRHLTDGLFGALTDAILDLCRSMRHLAVTDTEVALLSVICLFSGDRFGLVACDQVEQIQESFLVTLQHYSRKHHHPNRSIYPKLLNKIVELRGLSVRVAEDIMSLQSPGSELAPLLHEMLDRVENVFLNKYQTVTHLTSTQYRPKSFFNYPSTNYHTSADDGGRLSGTNGAVVVPNKEHANGVPTNTGHSNVVVVTGNGYSSVASNGAAVNGNVVGMSQQKLSISSSPDTTCTSTS